MATQASILTASGMEGLLNPQPLPDVDALVRRVENACRTAQPLPEEDLVRLGDLGAARVKLVAAGEDLARLRNFGHRIWCACSAPGASGIKGKPEALLRQVGCDLFSASLAGASEIEQPRNRALLAAQWAVAGRAWAANGCNQEALRCFQAACDPWAAVVSSLNARTNENTSDVAKDVNNICFAEAACQARMWASDVHFQLGAYEIAVKELTEAHDTFVASPELRSQMSEELLKCSYKQALAHLNAASPTLAIDLLTLAVAALRNNSSGTTVDSKGICDNRVADNCRLMRQLALAYAAAAKTDFALSHAREAVSLAPLSSSDQAAGLQVWLGLLCENSNLSTLEAEIVDGVVGVSASDGRAEEVRSVALRLMRVPAASTQDCIEACQLLLQKEFSQDIVFACLSELSSRLQSVEGVTSSCELGQTLVFRLRLAAESVHKSLCKSDGVNRDHSAARLEDACSDAETAVANNVSGLRDTAIDILRRLAGVAIRAGEQTEAMRWLKRALSFSEVADDVSELWCTMGTCHWHLGEHEAAADCANKALAMQPNQLQGSLLALFTIAAGVGKADVPNSSSMETSCALVDQALNLLTRIQSHPNFSVSHAARIAQEFFKLPSDVLSLAGLEVWATRFVRFYGAKACKEGADTSATQTSDADDAGKGLVITRELITRARSLERPDAELLRYLGLATDASKLAFRNLLDELQHSEGFHSGGKVFELRCIFTVAWERGLMLGQEKRWAECSPMFEAALDLLEPLATVAVDEVKEARAWCLVLLASAALQRAKQARGQAQERHELTERSLHCIDRVHQICRQFVSRSTRHTQPMDDGRDNQEGASFRDKIFNVLVLLEFEVRSLAGESELQLRRFVDQASSSDSVGIESLLAMSKIAAANSSRRLAIHCLQRFLRVFVVARHASDYSLCASAYREMIALHASRNESFVVYEGILNLLSGSGADVSRGIGPETCVDGSESVWPQEELMWLAATAWNNGAHFCKLQQYRWSEKWMAKSLAFAKLCPEKFCEEDMRDHYTRCLQHCSE